MTEETPNVDDLIEGAPEAPSIEEDLRSELERERDEFRDMVQRLQADFENYRKRVARDADDAATRAAGSLVNKMLPVLDAFDLASQHFADSEADEAKGLNQARGLLLDTLAREGLERVDAVGIAFDPQVHDAVMHVEGDGSGDQVIDEVLRAGYLWKGSVLRPAMVKVKG